MQRPRYQLSEQIRRAINEKVKIVLGGLKEASANLVEESGASATPEFKAAAIIEALRFVIRDPKDGLSYAKGHQLLSQVDDKFDFAYQYPLYFLDNLIDVPSTQLAWVIQDYMRTLIIKCIANHNGDFKEIISGAEQELGYSGSSNESTTPDPESPPVSQAAAVASSSAYHPQNLFSSPCRIASQPDYFLNDGPYWFPDHDYELNLMFIGSFSAGRKALLRALVNEPYDKKYKWDETTLINTIKRNGNGIKLLLLLFRPYLRDYDALIFVCDLNDPRTFTDQTITIHLNGWPDRIKVNSPVILVGTKCDLKKMDQESFYALARRHNFHGAIQVSAKTGENVEALVDLIINMVAKFRRYPSQKPNKGCSMM